MAGPGKLGFKGEIPLAQNAQRQRVEALCLCGIPVLCILCFVLAWVGFGDHFIHWLGEVLQNILSAGVDSLGAS